MKAESRTPKRDQGSHPEPPLYNLTPLTPTRTPSRQRSPRLKQTKTRAPVHPGHASYRTLKHCSHSRNPLSQTTGASVRAMWPLTQIATQYAANGLAVAGKPPAISARKKRGHGWRLAARGLSCVARHQCHAAPPLAGAKGGAACHSFPLFFLRPLAHCPLVLLPPLSFCPSRRCVLRSRLALFPCLLGLPSSPPSPVGVVAPSPVALGLRPVLAAAPSSLCPFVSFPSPSSPSPSPSSSPSLPSSSSSAERPLCSRLPAHHAAPKNKNAVELPPLNAVELHPLNSLKLHPRSRDAFGHANLYQAPAVAKPPATAQKTRITYAPSGRPLIPRWPCECSRDKRTRKAI